MDNKANLKKISKAAILVNTTQVVMIAAFFVYLSAGLAPEGGKLEAGGGTLFFLLIILLSVMMNYYITFKYMNLVLFNNKYYTNLRETNTQLESLNNTLRAQRHDFMNHLQVVYSLMELDDYNEAKDYIEKVYCDIQKVNRALRTSIPAINALLQAKLISAEKNGIIVRINITTSLSKLTIPAWELCRVMGNLIDNAVFALQTVADSEHRELCIEIFEELKTYGFRIRNNGPAIPKQIIDQIFDSGFTTKKDRGDGMGLPITKEILERYKGEISFISNEEFTEFTGMLPKGVEHSE